MIKSLKKDLSNKKGIASKHNTDKSEENLQTFATEVSKPQEVVIERDQPWGQGGSYVMRDGKRVKVE